MRQTVADRVLALHAHTDGRTPVLEAEVQAVAGALNRIGGRLVIEGVRPLPGYWLLSNLHVHFGLGSPVESTIGYVLSRDGGLCVEN